MKVSATSPVRISLFGGGTDVGEYASKYGGICINIAINIRQKVTINVEEQKLLKNDNPDFFKAFTDLKVEHKFDGKIESGLGSSAALAVALTKALEPNLNNYQVAERAWNIEVNKLGLFGGKQDQYASSFGGANLLLFQDKVYRYSLPREKIEKILPYLVLFDSGITRQSTNIQDGLKKIDTKQKINLDRIKEITYDAIDAIWNGDINLLGMLMDEAWSCKKDSNTGVSSWEISKLYTKARNLGAIGGKILGSGGGGHMLFVTLDPEKLISEMPLKYIPFEIDWEGVKIE